MHRTIELEQSLVEFSVKLIQCIARIESKIPRSVSDQIIRSATSVGANYTEAINGSSKADFRNKIFIAKKEASETKYWLRIIQKLIDEPEIADLLGETQKYIMILQKTVNTLKNSGEKGKTKK